MMLNQCVPYIYTHTHHISVCMQCYFALEVSITHKQVVFINLTIVYLFPGCNPGNHSTVYKKFSIHSISLLGMYGKFTSSMAVVMTFNNS